MHMLPHPHYPPPLNPYAPPPPPQLPHPHVKPEPVDARYVLAAHPGLPSYALPALPGPQLNGSPRPPHPGGQQSVLSFAPPAPGTGPTQPNASPAPPRIYTPLPPPQPAPQQQQRIPQVDGPSSSSDDSASPPPSHAPHSSHPSLLQPPSQVSGSTQLDDPEAINSDLDDSDTEGEEEVEEGGAGESDIVFCTYDKVARVKNKWKCILKDGMIHINGRDYLFAKCTGYVSRHIL
jgi:transcription initiation factor TFIIA large subunit